MDPNLSYPWKQERICFVPTRITDHGSRITDHGSRITDHGSRITDHGSRITDHGSRITDHGSRITDHGSTDQRIHTYTKEAIGGERVRQGRIDFWLRAEVGQLASLKAD